MAMLVSGVHGALYSAELSELFGAVNMPVWGVAQAIHQQPVDGD